MLNHNHHNNHHHQQQEDNTNDNSQSSNSSLSLNTVPNMLMSVSGGGVCADVGTDSESNPITGGGGSGDGGGDDHRFKSTLPTSQMDMEDTDSMTK